MEKGLILGFYHHAKTAEQVISLLKKQGYYRSALIHYDHKETFFKDSWFSYGYHLFDTPIEKLHRYESLLLPHEILMLIEVDTSDLREVLHTLHQIKEYEPVTFVFLPFYAEERDYARAFLPRKPLTNEGLVRHASSLAKKYATSQVVASYGKPLLNRLETSGKIFGGIYKNLQQALHLDQSTTLSCEWLLDNAYVIQAHIEDIKRNLPKWFYKELPKITKGNMQDLPRVYGLAVELVTATDGRLDEENIKSFLNAYQSVTPLTIGELWAFPLLLRLRLIECLQHLAIRVINRQRESQEADFWSNRLLNAVRRVPEKLYSFIAELSKDKPFPSSHFADQMIDHLSDEKEALVPVRAWLSHKLGEEISQVIQEERHQQMTEQVSLSNAITSLLRLSRLDWREVFESTSIVDKLFSAEASGEYLQMNFDTRDLYRHALEKIAKKAEISETILAQQAVEMTLNGNTELEKHIGYYLVDKGRILLEKACGCTPTFFERVKSWFVEHVSYFFFSAFALITFLILFDDMTIWWLLIIPASEISVQIVNYLFTALSSPTILPKMLFKDGVPEQYRTLIVVPMILTDLETIQSEIEKLEIRYLGNVDPNFRYGLIADFTDAPQMEMPDDEKKLNAAIKGIQSLNEKHGIKSFFLFYRLRSWNEAEKSWMGWERKRGKIEMLNRFLLGEPPGKDNLLYYGDFSELKGVSFVITLDADTQLLRGKARSLVETIAHPLNRPYIDREKKEIERGYTIVQPRVSTSLFSDKPTYFTDIFADHTGTDPYNWAISDLYQDIFNEGIYHGKGIYDLKTFHVLLDKRLPSNLVLSHDLLEGAYVRTGFASDIELYDEFPKDYFSYAKRLHRWIRGDWQLLNWLTPKVPVDGDQKEQNPLSFINRWKIFDNLRRSLVYPSLILLLLVTWFKGSWTGSLITLILLMMPGMLPPSWGSIKKNALRGVIDASTLPYRAYLCVDAIVRALYRQYFSKKSILEWSVAANRERSNPKTGLVSIFAAVVFGLLLWKDSSALLAALPFLLLWFVSPLVVTWLNKIPEKTTDKDLKGKDKQFLRFIARTTWRFFDDFVTDKTNWLPPDNYQEMLRVELANRTSSTNIGLYLLSVVSAREFGYVTPNEILDRIQKSFATIKKLELYEGHLLNWYNIETLEPLHPRYVSTVDSGNLIACLWVLEQSINDIINSPVIDQRTFSGLEDDLIVIKKLFKVLPATGNDHLPLFSALFSLLSNSASTLLDSLNVLEKVKILAGQLEEKLRQNYTIGAEEDYWLQKFQSKLGDWRKISDTYLSWVKLFETMPKELADTFPMLGDVIDRYRLKAPTLNELAKEFSLSSVHGFAPQNLTEASKEWVNNWQNAFNHATDAAKEQVHGALESMAYSRSLESGMQMGFLYLPERKLFSTGYNVNDRRLDNSFYDLLASEARIASFISIARGEIPQEHWWALGRPFGPCFGRIVLQSWGGTMFEYLMPLLFMRSYDHTLLSKAYTDAVACQIEYGKVRALPWGISESAYSGLDYHRIYQYRAFGVPGLGLKRGLEEDLVITPYSSALALMVDPHASVSNLKKLANGERMQGAYGFYEAIDYTREHDPQGERGVIIYAYMAHHIGMTLLSITNILNAEIFQRLFHADPRVAASESLLYERISIPSTHPEVHFREAPLPKVIPFTQEEEIEDRASTPNTSIPHIQLLSNGVYSVMISNSGSGYSRWEDIDVTRWRVDSTADRYGSFFYIKDVEKNLYWPSTYAPMCVKPSFYEVNFKTDKAEFKRRDFGIETVSEIVVSPEDQAEIRGLVLANLSTRTRTLEITSYQELVLAHHAADRSHPAFSKMFVQTEAVPDFDGLLAFRRQRSPEDPVYWAVHVLAVEDPDNNSEIQYETSRANFIGRGNNTDHPQALDNPLTNTLGCVLDPIFSIRKRLVIQPGKRVKLSFVTAMAKSRKDALGLLQKYHDYKASQRAIDMAWAHSELDLRFLHIGHEKVQLFQQLGSRIIYPHAHLRASAEYIRGNKLGQRNLWSYGISGDLPIMVIIVSSFSEIDVVKEMITAHTFLRMKGLVCDLVILNEEPSSYEQTLHDKLQKLVHAYAYLTGLNKPGGIFLLIMDKILPEEIKLILASARVILYSSRGTMRQQISLPIPTTSLPPVLVPTRQTEELSPQLPFLELLFFNGMGGFTSDFKEYAIYIDQKIPPHPWVNVMANRNFGTMAAAQGSVTTWNINAQSNRLTSWSNDPVVNRVSDVLYLRNEESGVFWTLASSPIKEQDPYRTRHGQGYTFYEHNSHAIEQELLVFVPIGHDKAPSVRIQKLRLFNKSSKRCRISATTYHELVLGTDREETQTHIVTSWNSECQALFATNTYHPNFGNCVTFITSLPLPASFTADRTEFIGRNGTLSSPAALKRRHLSRKSGTALDPCAALQVVLDIDPDEQIETLFLIGEASSIDEAREIINYYRDHYVIEQAFEETRYWWDHLLTTIQIKTPDLATNILFNRWLLYQNLSCRIWARFGFYQCSGAYGFRDQLQDVSALFYSFPGLAREQILRAASRQFVEGDVQHWWHPQSGEGVRTRISDDLLWLPFVTANYVNITGDTGILSENIHFLEGKLLTEDEHEVFGIPTISKESASLLEHCCRSIEKALVFGEHELPLIGGGDWNDGLNWVGHKGKGESVWLAWFLIVVMRGMIPFVSEEKGKNYQEMMQKIALNIEKHAWDGEWYIRAFYDDGSPLGSKDCQEARIDSIAQSWSILSGMADPKRSELAMRSVEQNLVMDKQELVLLFDPPFNHTEQNPGYIKGYPPGVRENGGQYTHAALWYASALAYQGKGDEAFKILKMLNPINHALTEEAVEKYRVEPYVVSADIYSLCGHVGQGGWTWYTGSAGVMYRVWLEDVIGFKLREGNRLEINPSIPSDWPEFSIHYRYLNTFYEIKVENPNRKCRGVEKVILDGKEQTDKVIMLVDDHQTHQIQIIL